MKNNPEGGRRSVPIVVKIIEHRNYIVDISVSIIYANTQQQDTDTLEATGNLLAQQDNGQVRPAQIETSEVTQAHLQRVRVAYKDC